MYFVLRIKSMEGVVVLLLSLLSCCLAASGNVVLIGNNVTMAFDDVEANFAPAIKGSGEHGVLYLAEPIDACSDLSNQAKKGSNRSSPFVLIIRGGCSFEDKVRRAQKAGYKAAIIYDNEEGILVAMAGNSAGVTIPAIFVSKKSGETLKKYAGLTDMELWIIPTFQNSAWSIMAIAFISLLAMAAVLATCFFVRRHHITREHPPSSNEQEFHGMSRRLVKAMPSLAFTSALEDNCTSTTCAICLEDYTVGEKLRILPCRHKFHAFCVDSWLTTWRTFCPVCKRDARTSTGEPPATESTPLLTSNPSSFASSSMLSSFRSGTSTAIQITPSRTPSVSHIPSHSSTPYVPQSSLRSYRHSPSITLSQRSADLRNMSSQRLHGSFLVSSHSLGYPSISPHSLGYPSISPLNTRYMSSYITSPSYASPSLVSSYHQPRPLHCSESAASFSPFASAQSLPDC